MIRPLILAAALVACVLPAHAQQKVAIRSGLPWASGAGGYSGGMEELEAMRGRPLDVRVLFLPIDRWSNMIAGAKHAGTHARTGARISIGIGMLPEESRGQHMACWQQRFAHHIRAIGAGLINNGAPDAIIRLGWEANRPNGYPWAVVKGKEREYIGCFRKWVNQLRSLAGQRFVIDWNMQDKSGFPASAIYPGGAWVDLIGINVYDRCPPIRDDAAWTQWIYRKHGDGWNPRGPATWLEFATTRGKKLSIPEWGIGGAQTVKYCSEPGFDNAWWVRKWHGWLSANAGHIAYAAYSNFHGDGQSNGIAPTKGGSHRLAPSTWNPQSSAVYRELWGG